MPVGGILYFPMPLENNDWPACLAVIGCVCMEAILSDYRCPNAFYIHAFISCVFNNLCWPVHEIANLSKIQNADASR